MAALLKILISICCLYLSLLTITLCDHPFDGIFNSTTIIMRKYKNGTVRYFRKSDMRPCIPPTIDPEIGISLGTCYDNQTETSQQNFYLPGPSAAPLPIPPPLKKAINSSSLSISSTENTSVPFTSHYSSTNAANLTTQFQQIRLSNDSSRTNHIITKNSIPDDSRSSYNVESSEIPSQNKSTISTKSQSPINENLTDNYSASSEFTTSSNIHHQSEISTTNDSASSTYSVTNNPVADNSNSFLTKNFNTDEFTTVLNEISKSTNLASSSVTDILIGDNSSSTISTESITQTPPQNYSTNSIYSQSSMNENFTTRGFGSSNSTTIFKNDENKISTSNNLSSITNTAVADSSSSTIPTESITQIASQNDSTISPVPQSSVTKNANIDYSASSESTINLSTQQYETTKSNDSSRTTHFITKNSVSNDSLSLHTIEPNNEIPNQNIPTISTTSQSSIIKNLSTDHSDSFESSTDLNTNKYQISILDNSSSTTHTNSSEYINPTPLQNDSTIHTSFQSIIAENSTDTTSMPNNPRTSYSSESSVTEISNTNEFSTEFVTSSNPKHKISTSNDSTIPTLFTESTIKNDPRTTNTTESIIQISNQNNTEINTTPQSLVTENPITVTNLNNTNEISTVKNPSSPILHFTTPISHTRNVKPEVVVRSVAEILASDPTFSQNLATEKQETEDIPSATDLNTLSEIAFSNGSSSTTHVIAKKILIINRDLKSEITSELSTSASNYNQHDSKIPTTSQIPKVNNSNSTVLSTLVTETPKKDILSISGNSVSKNSTNDNSTTTAN